MSRRETFLESARSANDQALTAAPTASRTGSSDLEPVRALGADLAGKPGDHRAHSLHRPSPLRLERSREVRSGPEGQVDTAGGRDFQGRREDLGSIPDSLRRSGWLVLLYRDGIRGVGQGRRHRRPPGTLRRQPLGRKRARPDAGDCRAPVLVLRGNGARKNRQALMAKSFPIPARMRFTFYTG